MDDTTPAHSHLTVERITLREGNRASVKFPGFATHIQLRRIDVVSAVEGQLTIAYHPFSHEWFPPLNGHEFPRRPILLTGPASSA